MFEKIKTSLKEHKRLETIERYSNPTKSITPAFLALPKDTQVEILHNRFKAEPTYVNVKREVLAMNLLFGDGEILHSDDGMSVQVTDSLLHFIPYWLRRFGEVKVVEGAPVKNPRGTWVVNGKRLTNPISFQSIYRKKSKGLKK